MTQLGRTRTAGRMKSGLIGPSFWAVAGLGVPVAILATSSAPLARASVVLTIVITFYAATRLAILLAVGRPHIIQGVFWLFVYVAMGIAPLCQISTGLYPGLISTDYLTVAAFMVLLGCLAYDLAFLVPQRQRKRKSDRADSRTGKIVSVRRIMYLGIVGLLGSAIYVSKVGVSALFTSRQSLAEEFSSSGLRSSNSQVGSAIVLAIGTIPILVAWVCWTSLLVRESSRRTGGGLLWWVVLLSVNIVVNNPISNARYWFLTVLFSLIFTLPVISPRVFRVAIILGIVSAAVFFPYSDYFRKNPTEPTTAVQSKSLKEELSTKDYDQTTIVADGIWWVENNGYRSGQQLLSDGLFFIPRSAWPGRAIDTGVIIGQSLPTAAVNANVSSPLWIELWIDFSWPGLLIGFYAVGRLTRRADQRFVDALERGGRTDLHLISVVVPMLAGYEFILLRGPMLQAMSRLSVIVICLAFVGARRMASADSPADADTPTPVAPDAGRSKDGHRDPVHSSMPQISVSPRVGPRSTGHSDDRVTGFAAR